MAKLKGPLFSLGASQKLGDALVFFNWKGLNVVRQHVVPANPRSSGQTTQRGYITAAVSAIHTAQALDTNPLDEADQFALSQLGLTFPTPRTWFNQQCKLWIDCKIAGDVPIVYRNGTTNDTDLDAVDLRAQLSEETGATLAAATVYMGKTRTSLVHSYALVVDAGVKVTLTNQDISDWASVGDKIYWQIKPDSGDGCEGANSGIYSFVGT